MLATSQTAAALLPVVDLDEAKITGDVNVQVYLSGDYPDPATARGWRLLSSPVYTENSETKLYAIDGFKKSMFVTGKGGSTSGFDPSPANGGTIYTHDQSISGTLSQKYIAIPNSSSTVHLGKGVYVFSRGDRKVENAYENQIQTAPFSNPAGYVINHTGSIHLGDLSIELFNKNIGENGEGFNLLGNPYPAPVRWGNLVKTNLSNFIWLFDPVNSAYIVSNEPSTIIPSGAGFFVKVLNGLNTGSLKFTEQSKYANNTPVLPRLLQVPNSALKKETTSSLEVSGGVKETSPQLTVQLKRGDFEQQCVISFAFNGNDLVNDKDALKLGEGYVSIASVVNKNKLTFDERSALTKSAESRLYIKGWKSGNYLLNLHGIETFDSSTSISLVDKYLNITYKILPSKDSYRFSMDESIPESWGENRFTILFEPLSNHSEEGLSDQQELTLYPNPMNDRFYLQNNLEKAFSAKLVFSNFYGQTVLTQNLLINANANEINVSGLSSGIYLIRLINPETNQTIKTFKVFKR